MSIAASDIIVTGTSKHDLAALTQLAGDGEDALLRVLHLAHSHRAGRLKFVLHGLGRALRHAAEELGAHSFVGALQRGHQQRFLYRTTQPPTAAVCTRVSISEDYNLVLIGLAY